MFELFKAIKPEPVPSFKELESRTAVMEEQVRQEAETVPVGKVPYLDSADQEAIDRAEWLALAKGLGITVGKVPTVELQEFCHEEGIQVFNTKKVFDYLTAEAEKSNTVWTLQPFRDVDMAMIGIPIWASVVKWPDSHAKKTRQFRNYVPIPVMLTAKKLVDKFGDRIHFLIASTDNDPFLGVVLDGGNIIFVERWDEPSFRG